MGIRDYSGYWTGAFEGTNQGGLTLDLRQDGKEISGKATLAEPAHGQYDYSISGLADEKFSARVLETSLAASISGPFK